VRGVHDRLLFLDSQPGTPLAKSIQTGLSVNQSCLEKNPWKFTTFYFLDSSFLSFVRLVILYSLSCKDWSTLDSMRMESSTVDQSRMIKVNGVPRCLELEPKERKRRSSSWLTPCEPPVGWAAVHGNKVWRRRRMTLSQWASIPWKKKRKLAEFQMLDWNSFPFLSFGPAATLISVSFSLKEYHSSTTARNVVDDKRCPTWTLIQHSVQGSDQPIHVLRLVCNCHLEVTVEDKVVDTQPINVNWAEITTL